MTRANRCFQDIDVAVELVKQRHAIPDDPSVDNGTVCSDSIPSECDKVA
jgi:hypothetical protein